jgi:hypothetical protein
VFKYTRMDFNQGLSFGYDQVGTNLYEAPTDSYALISSHNSMSNDVERRLNAAAVQAYRMDQQRLRPDPISRDGLIRQYIKDKVKKEIEQHELKKAKYTGEDENFASCGCRSGGGDDWSFDPKKDNGMLLLLFIVVVVFCLTQYVKIQSLTKDLASAMRRPAAAPNVGP